MAKLKVAQYAACLEVSTQDHATTFHPHTHGIVNTPSRGRGYIPNYAWEDEWLNALPTHLHPVAPAHCAPVRNLEASVAYITKSPYAAWLDGQDISQTIAAIDATRNLHKAIQKGITA
jgi:hypothetical protein